MTSLSRKSNGNGTVVIFGMSYARKLRIWEECKCGIYDLYILLNRRVDLMYYLRQLMEIICTT